MKRITKILEVTGSGILGVILTLVVQYFFIQPQTTIYYNGQEMNEADIISIMEENVELAAVNNALNEEKSKLMKELENLNKQYTELGKQNNELSEKYNTENNQLLQENVDLKNQLDNMVDVQLKDMSLSINGDSKAINSSQASAVINNKIYYSEDILKCLIDDNTSMTIQDNTMYIGRIIKDSTSLLDDTIWLVDSQDVSNVNSVKDSLGETHTNALLFSRGGKNIYNLKGEYSLIKFKLALKSSTELDFEGILTIKADDKIVYESPILKKENASYDEIDIPINNCSLLTIEFNYTYSRGYCIMSDIVIYN